MKVDELREDSRPDARPRSTAALGSALEALPEIEALIGAASTTLIFLDYDGTLTPIVSRPELARLDEAVRALLQRLAQRYAVTIISGRGLDDVRSLVGLEGIDYAGGHGFEMAGAEGLHSPFQEDSAVGPALDLIEESLHERLDDLPGVLIERKPFSVAVHFRLASADDGHTTLQAVEETVARHEGVRLCGGKKVVEIRPDVDWDKGRAVEWLLRTSTTKADTALAIYVGDDLTDEDAFRYLNGRGVSVIVRDPTPRETYADLALESPDEVRMFLEALVDIPTSVAHR